ncbi:GTP-binding protein, partial [Staphylococcus hominis]|uniref:GTP-binding protein n=1 Tax=Staphylococcus hominis TaxID=1290 RepID=UPI0028D35C5B
MRDEGWIGDLLIEEVELCDVVVLNKRDLVRNEGVDKLEDIVRRLEGDGKIIKRRECEVDINDVLDRGGFAFEKG